MDMEKQYIKNLIDKYFNAETTRNEECLLKHYFSQDSIDPELESYTSLFRLFIAEKQVEAPENAADKLKLLQQQADKKRGRFIPYFSISVAAGLIILLTIGLFNSKSKTPTDGSVYIVMYSNGQQVDNPIAALEFAEQEFSKISAVFSEVNRVIKEPINTVEQSLEPLRKTNEELGKARQILNFMGSK